MPGESASEPAGVGIQLPEESPRDVPELDATPEDDHRDPVLVGIAIFSGLLPPIELDDPVSSALERVQRAREVGRSVYPLSISMEWGDFHDPVFDGTDEMEGASEYRETHDLPEPREQLKAARDAMQYCDRGTVLGIARHLENQGYDDLALVLIEVEFPIVRRLIDANLNPDIFSVWRGPWTEFHTFLAMSNCVGMDAEYTEHYAELILRSGLVIQAYEQLFHVRGLDDHFQELIFMYIQMLDKATTDYRACIMRLAGMEKLTDVCALVIEWPYHGVAADPENLLRRTQAMVRGAVGRPAYDGEDAKLLDIIRAQTEESLTRRIERLIEELATAESEQQTEDIRLSIQTARTFLGNIAEVEECSSQVDRLGLARDEWGARVFSEVTG